MTQSCRRFPLTPLPLLPSDSAIFCDEVNRLLDHQLVHLACRGSVLDKADGSCDYTHLPRRIKNRVAFVSPCVRQFESIAEWLSEQTIDSLASRFGQGEL